MASIETNCFHTLIILGVKLLYKDKNVDNTHVYICVCC